MWTFEILNRTKTDENTIEIVVKFDNGTTNFQRTFYATKGIATRSWFERMLKQEVEEFENRKAFNLDIKKGVFTLTPTPTPTQADLDRVEFFNKVPLLDRKTRLVALGLIPASDLVSLKTRLLELLALYPSLADEVQI